MTTLFHRYETINLLAEQLLWVLDYLHRFNSPVIHRDLKPPNFLIDAQQQVYLIDFDGVQNITPLCLMRPLTL